jgi:hypothetical protein
MLGVRQPNRRIRHDQRSSNLHSVTVLAPMPKVRNERNAASVAQNGQLGTPVFAGDLSSLASLRLDIDLNGQLRSPGRSYGSG